MLKNKTRNLLLGGIVISILFSLYWFKTEIDDLNTTRIHRNNIKSKLHLQVQKQYGAILSSELDSHCGKAIYSLVVNDGYHPVELHFDIDTGQELGSQWMKNCLLEHSDDTVL